MTRTEHLLFCLSEECNEIGKQASKAARFGLAHGQPSNNAERIMYEVADLLGVLELLEADGQLRGLDDLRPRIDAKKEKIETYLRYSEYCRTLE